MKKATSEPALKGSFKPPTMTAASTGDRSTAVDRAIHLCNYMEQKLKDINDVADLTGLDLPFHLRVNLATEKPSQKCTRTANSSDRTRPMTSVSSDTESLNSITYKYPKWASTRAVVFVVVLCDYVQAIVDDMKEAA